MSSNRIRDLVEEWLKSGNDAVPDALKNLLEHDRYCQVHSRRILERYKSGSLDLHFAFEEGFRIGCAARFSICSNDARSNGRILAATSFDGRKIR